MYYRESMTSTGTVMKGVQMKSLGMVFTLGFGEFTALIDK